MTRRWFVWFLASLFGFGCGRPVKPRKTPAYVPQLDSRVRTSHLISWDFQPGDPRPDIITARRAVILDAQGREWPRVIWCDTETGQLKRQVVVSGRVLIDNNNDVMTEIVYAPAPLRVDWRDTCESLRLV